MQSVQVLQVNEKTGKKNYQIVLYAGLFACFLLSPFGAFTVSLTLLLSKNWSRKEYMPILSTIALFGALLAFTQNTDTGDIGRVYSGITQNTGDISFMSALLISLAESKYILFAIVNAGIFKLTGNVQYVSFFWIFIVYEALFAGILNLLEYKRMGLDKRTVGWVVCASVFCFIIFTQITEIMKQSVAISLCFYAYSCYLQNRTKLACAVFFLSLGIHFSPFFFLPIILARRLKGKVVWIITCASFLFRKFNLMSFASGILGKIGGISTLADLADMYQTNDTDFYQSSSFYFVISFGFLFVMSTCIYHQVRLKDTTLIKSVLLMIAVLNLSYENAHNFTRLMTTLFPFYCMLMIDLLDKGANNKLRMMFLQLLVIGAFFLNYTLASGRLSPGSSYATSYMDNSLCAIVTSSSIGYFQYKI